MTHKEIGLAIGLSHGWVRNYCYFQKLRKGGFKLSESEKNEIKNYYEKFGNDLINPLRLGPLSKKLGRTRHLICRYAREMGLSSMERVKHKTDEERLRIGEKAKIRIAKNGHPRGMLGKKHTRESIERGKLKRMETWDSKTPEWKREIVMKILKSRLENPINFRPRHGASWKQGWEVVGEKRRFFRSSWEKNYAHYLEWLKGLGEIRDWDFETKVFWFEGLKRGVMSYKPDFMVTEKNGAIEFHEVKGWMDKKSLTKIKRMRIYHPSVKLKVIDKPAYYALKKSVGMLVPGWEMASR
jgi:predicted DNA-binding protein